MKNQKIWIIQWEINEDDHREGELGPFVEKHSKEEASKLVRAYAGCKDGVNGWMEISHQQIYKNVTEFLNAPENAITKKDWEEIELYGDER